MIIGNFKRGDTFSFYADLKDGAGNAIANVATKLKSQVRDKTKKLLADLNVTDGGAVGRYLLTAPVSTQNWTLGEISIDVEYNNNGVITSTQTFTYNVVEDVTQ